MKIHHKPLKPSDELLIHIKGNFILICNSVVRVGDGYIGSLNVHGYRQFKFKTEGKIVATVQSHHISWYIVYDKWPEEMLDHQDRNKENNWIDNLRYADRLLNGLNRCKKSGLPPGVKLKKSGYYEAYIRYNGKKIFCGSCKTPKDAEMKYRNMYKVLYGKELEITVGGESEN